MKKILFFFLLACLLPLTNVSKCKAKSVSERLSFALPQPDTNGLRSDTINVLSYNLFLNITDFTHDTLRGNTIVRFTPKMNNIKSICLDLLHFKVDSVLSGATHLAFSYNDTLLTIALPVTENIGDTASVNVYYHGKPVLDPSGWGGFYFSPPYAFNLGVGFDVIPHNFGRSWYPCFDNFIAKSTFTFHITTDTANLSFCNGYLTKDSVSGANRIRTWVMPYPISSYHACVDVAPYTSIRDTFRGMDTIPILLNALPADTAKLRKSFVHLKNAIAIFQKCYGKYQWNKVGYSLESFSNGAMEHATNIAYPALAADGTTTYEANLMAHELSHHWCGDLVTCSSAEDMWLNEGFAWFNQSVFLQGVYGDSTYNTYTRNYHDQAVHYCAIADHGYWALAHMPQRWTYGNDNYWVSTTYEKGGDVLRTLRTYLGDSAFFKGMKYYFATHKYQPVSADTLKNSLQRYTGYNLTDFFNDWVFAPGFPQFSIDSMITVPNGPNYNATVYIRQKLTGAPSYYTNVPMQVTFKSASRQSYTQTLMVSGQLSGYTVLVPFKPVFAGLNMRTNIAEAVSSDTLIVTKPGNYNMGLSRVDMWVKAAPDTAFLFLEHNYAAPDPVTDTALHYRISNYRYWNVSGIRPGLAIDSARLYYDGRKGIAYNGSFYLDTALMKLNDDSIILLYRPDTRTGWSEFPAYRKHNIGTPTNKLGYMTLDSLPNGQYTFANGKSKVLGVPLPAASAGKLLIYPNPAPDGFTVEFPPATGSEEITVYDMNGKIMAGGNILAGQNRYYFNSGNWAQGGYMIRIQSAGRELASGEIVIQR